MCKVTCVFLIKEMAENQFEVSHHPVHVARSAVHEYSNDSSMDTGGGLSGTSSATSFFDTIIETSRETSREATRSCFCIREHEDKTIYFHTNLSCHFCFLFLCIWFMHIFLVLLQNCETDFAWKHFFCTKLCAQITVFAHLLENVHAIDFWKYFRRSI